MVRLALLVLTGCAALAPPHVLLISGSDSGGGAGLQADVKTCEALGVFSTNAVTAVTAQNTVGVRGVHGVPPAFIVQQMDAVFDDFGVDAAKTGLLASADVVEAVARRLRGATVAVVVDPVVCAASGDVFVDQETIEAIKAELLPLATVLTPNAAEAQLLAGDGAGATLSVARARALAARLLEHGPAAVVVKGARRVGDEALEGAEWVGPPRAPGDGIVVDVCAFADGSFASFACPAVATRNTHGTGCTFSAAVAARLASGDAPRAAIRAAKMYVDAALRASAPLTLGRGAHGPLHHGFLQASWPA